MATTIYEAMPLLVLGGIIIVCVAHTWAPSGTAGRAAPATPDATLLFSAAAAPLVDASSSIDIARAGAAVVKNDRSIAASGRDGFRILPLASQVDFIKVALL